MLDGVVLSHIILELKKELIGGRIDKIYQPEKEELLISVRNNRKAYKLLLNANSSYPRVHISTLTKNTNATPPMFCMLLRKHLSSGKILDITQPNFERIVEIHIEATNDLGDKENKKLILEIMGRHSNLIFTHFNKDGKEIILDSIKHISRDKSSIRTVLPSHQYNYPPNQLKLNPTTTDFAEFSGQIAKHDAPVYKSLYLSYNGLSPMIAHEICIKSELDGEFIASKLTNEQLNTLFKSFTEVMNAPHQPVLYVNESEIPVECYAYPLDTYKAYTPQFSESMSEIIEQFTHKKNQRFNIGQKTSDIKKLVQTYIERALRKKVLQEKAIEDSSSSELYKIYGELLTSYSHSVPPRAESFTTMNYYTEPYEDITIPLDPDKTAIENAQKYFKVYNKSKRTFVAATEQLEIIEEDVKYLQSVLISLDMLQSEGDILELRQELIEMGYMKRRAKHPKKVPKNTHPYMQFKTTSGLDVYVGKNNFQNDTLTMKFAKSNDLWLHIKDGPGSHVIIKVPHQYEISDQDILEGAYLASYFSSGKQSSHVPIDYTLRKNVKKIPNAKPGMVIYNNFKTISVTPEEKFISMLTPQ
ncbi:MAG: hypothetical protein ATN36_08365 [Epulopiscium sp. Nele67-Bin005]|nr:MAG: hypothetical protein ATN36_08365 [Epulopiscium sp. Nele67-Bin005]